MSVSVVSGRKYFCERQARRIMGRILLNLQGGIVNRFRKLMYGTAIAGLMLASSACPGWNHDEDLGYDRVDNRAAGYNRDRNRDRDGDRGDNRSRNDNPSEGYNQDRDRHQVGSDRDRDGDRDDTRNKADSRSNRSD